MIDKVIKILERKTTIPDNDITFTEICRVHTIAQESLLLWKEAIRELDKYVCMHISSDIHCIVGIECRKYIYKSINVVQVDTHNDFTIIDNTVKILSRLSTIPTALISFNNIEEAYDIAIQFLLAWDSVIEEIDNRIELYVDNTKDTMVRYCECLQECKQIIETYRDKNDFEI